MTTVSLEVDATIRPSDMGSLAIAGPMRFSTRDVPERDRVAGWREFYGRSVLRADVTPLPGQELHADVTMQALPDLRIVSASLSAMRYERSHEFVADGNDDLSLVMPCAELGVMTQRGRDVALNGGAFLMSAADAALMICPEPTSFLCLHMPRAALAPLVSNIDDAVMRSIPGNIEAVRLLVNYVIVVMQGQLIAAPGLQHLTAAHIHDLVALAIGATRDGTALAEGRGLHAARLSAIKADINNHLGDTELTVTTVALRHRLSPRHIQRLFAGEGTTFSDFVLNQRIARAHRHLNDPRHGHLSISAIAFDVGFGDLSYFNRTFRRRYGASPSEIRAASAKLV